MSRYRKIDPRFWKDEKVMALTAHEKLIALYLFTGQSNRIGLFNFSPGEAAEDLGVSTETFRKGFLEPFGKVCRHLNFGWDESCRVLYLPTWWKYNCPENPNVLKSCLADLHEIPQTRLVTAFSDNLLYLPETFHQTFREGLGKPSPKRMPHQEQEQEQEQQQEKEQEQEKEARSPTERAHAFGFDGNGKRRPREKAQRKHVADPLPDWLDPETWGAFKEMRVRIRKPMTGHAERLMFGRLTQLKAAGEDVKAVVEQSIRNDWQDVYALKDIRNGTGPKSKSEELREKTRQLFEEKFE